MIVITISLLLMVSAAVMLMPALQTRAVREAGRAVSTYLSAVRNNAMATGRPQGVTFRCASTATPYADTMTVCTVPPDFAGAYTASVATVTWDASTNILTATFYISSDTIATNLETVLSNTVRVGDEIQFNHQGPRFRINGPTAALDANGYFTGVSALTAELVDAGIAVPWTTTASRPLSYCIFRQPTSGSVTGYAAAAQQLPAGTVVDFTASGIGDENTYPLNLQTITFSSGSGTRFAYDETITSGSTKVGKVVGVVDNDATGTLTLSLTGTAVFAASDAITGSGGKTATVDTAAQSDISLMFAADGSVSACYAGGPRIPVIRPIYLLVGHRERMLNSFVATPASTNQDQLPNVQDVSNVWVVVNAQSGLVTTDTVATSTAATLAQTIIDARALARDAQGMGGK